MPPGEFLAAIEARWGRPAVIVCDRFRKAELLDALNTAGWRVPFLLRGMGYRDGSRGCKAFPRRPALDKMITAPASWGIRIRAFRGAGSVRSLGKLEACEGLRREAGKDTQRRPCGRLDTCLRRTSPPKDKSGQAASTSPGCLRWLTFRRRQRNRKARGSKLSVSESFKRRWQRSAEWRRIREHVLKRDGHKCRECGFPFRLEVDHIIRPEVGGELKALDNLQVLCRECHARKSAAEAKGKRRRKPKPQNAWEKFRDELG